MHHLSSKSFLLLILPLLSYAGVALLLSGPEDTQAQTATCTSTISPGQSIASALAGLQAGQTLCLRGGTYDESINSNNDKIPTGTSWNDAPQIKAYPGETPVLQPSGGSSGVLNLASYAGPNGLIQYLIIDGLTFDGLNTTNSDVVSLNGAKYVRIQNSEIKNSGPYNHPYAPINYAISVQQGSAEFNELLNSRIHNARGSHGLYIRGSNNLFDGLDVYDNHFCGMQLYATAGGVNNNVVRNSIFRGNGGFVNEMGAPQSCAGLHIGSGSGNMAYNNLAYDNKEVGIAVAYGSNSKVFNNTVYNNGQGGIVIGPSSGDTVTNNISYANGSAYGDLYDDAGATKSNNLIGTNPLFTNPSSTDFHLQSSSPARDAGISLPDVPCDFDGNARPAGSAYDIGAFEYGASPGTGCSKGGGGSPPTPTPIPPPVVTIAAIPSSISVVGQGITLSWSVTNADSCTASGGWSGTQATAGNTRFTPSATTIYTLTCTGPGGEGQGSATVTVGGSTSCTKYSSGSTIPAGFGVPWDVLSPTTLLLNAACTSPTVLLKVGNQNASNVLYVYKTAYSAPAGAQGWTPVDLFGSSLISQAWYRSFAQGVATIDTATPSYYVGYTCSWTGSKWMCGCRDSSCTQSYWQIQRVQL